MSRAGGRRSRRRSRGPAGSFSIRSPQIRRVIDLISTKEWMRSEWLRQQLRERRPVCAYCGRPVTKRNATVDHVVPRSRGGLDEPENWAVACKPCNSAKGNLTAEEFALVNRGRTNAW